MSIKHNVVPEVVPTRPRILPDRRRRPTPLLSRYWLWGRRRAGRREGEIRNVYVDRYTSSEWLLVFSILCLSLADMLLTLVHLKEGGREVNPLMDWAIQSGTPTFAVVKMGMTVLGLLVLLVHVRFRRVRGLLWFALTVYSALLVYHAYLRLLA